MNERGQLRSESLNLLRFPLAVVILSIHIFSSNGLKLQGQEVTFDATPIFQEINYFIDGFLRGQSVPIYFFISGYVFFLGITLTREKYLQKLHNRVKTLLIPFLFWNTLAILLTLLWRLPCFESLFPRLHMMKLDFSISNILYSYWNDVKGIFIPVELPERNDAIFPQNVPLWFLRDLMIVVLSTPAIYWIIKHTKYYFICMFGVAWFVQTYWELGHLNQLFTAFFFFSWGAYMSINKKDMLTEFGRYRGLSVVLYIGLSLLYVASVHYWPGASHTIKHLNIFVGLLFAYNLASWFIEHNICRPNAFLASASFFIYVSHALMCGYLLKVLFLVTRPTSNIGMLSVYISAVLLSVGSLLLVFWLMRRYTPNLLKIVAGRR